MKRLSMTVKERASATSPFYFDVRVAGKRSRKYFATRTDAVDALRNVKSKLKREGERALSLPDHVRIDALNLYAELEPYGKTIRDAGEYYLRYLKDTHRSITVAELVAKYIASRERVNSSDEHLKDMRYRYGRFSETFGNEPIRVLTAETVEAWLDNLGLGDRSVNNFHSRIKSLFKYGVEKHFLDRNVVADIERMKIDEEPPVILTVDALRVLLDAAPLNVLPVLAIASFAGVRTKEVIKLDWSQINLVRGYIEIRSKQAKTAKRRLIKIQENLKAWLMSIEPRIGPVWPYDGDHSQRSNAFQRAKRDLVKASGVPWPKNSSRHSFCSYHLAKYQDEGMLRNDMGHTNEKLIFDTYRELVYPEDGERYFNLFPPTPASNVVAMTA